MDMYRSIAKEVSMSIVIPLPLSLHFSRATYASFEYCTDTHLPTLLHAWRETERVEGGSGLH